MPFKAIKAKPINKQAMLREIRREVFSSSRNVIDDYEKTTSSWKKKVKFSVELTETSTTYQFFVGTDSKLYYMMDVTGAKPHPIFPVNAKALTVPTGFSPKTKVGVIGSTGGGRFGNIQLRASVRHPGFKARGFSKEIAKRLQKTFPENMQRAMLRVVEVSGHKL